MANTLKVDIEEMRAKASELSNKSNEMETIMRDMKRLVDNLQTAWNSNAGSEYVGKFNFITVEVYDALCDLRNHVKSLEDSATAYENAENEAENNIKNLSTGNIF